MPGNGEVGGTASRILNLAYMETSSQLRDRSGRFTTRLDTKQVVGRENRKTVEKCAPVVQPADGQHRGSVDS